MSLKLKIIAVEFPNSHGLPEEIQKQQLNSFNLNSEY